MPIEDSASVVISTTPLLKNIKIAYLVFSIHFIFKMDIIMDKKKVEFINHNILWIVY